MKIKRFFVVRCRNCGKFRVYSTYHDFIKQGTTFKCFSCNKTMHPNKGKSVGYNVRVEGPYLKGSEAGKVCAALNARGKQL